MDQNELKRTLASLGITDTGHNIRIDPGSGKIQRETYLNWEDTGYRIEPGTGKVQKDAWTHWEETGYRVDPGSGKIQKDAWTHWEETGRRVDPESGRIQKDAWTSWDDSGHRIEPDTGRLQRERWPGWEDAGVPGGIDPQSEVDSYAGHSSGSYSSISTGYSAPDYSSSGSSESSSKSGAGVGAVAIFLIIALAGAAYFLSRRSSGSQITGFSSSLPGVAYVNTKQLNVRNGPGSEYGTVSKLPLGTQVSTLQRAQSTDGGAWIKVRQDSVEGWVNEKLLSSDQKFEVPVGGVVNGFTYTSGGNLLYGQKAFFPAVLANITYVSAIRISFLKNKGLAAAITLDADGHNKLFLLNTGDFSSAQMQKAGTWNAAQKVFWSPSQKYLLVYCAYEGERFIGIDLNARRVKEGDFLGPEDKMWQVSNDPHWLGNSDILIFNVSEHCNPYDDPDCDYSTILASYEIQLDAASVKYSSKKIDGK